MFLGFTALCLATVLANCLLAQAPQPANPQTPAPEKKGREYTISGPRDLWNAVSEVVSRIAKSKQLKLSSGTPTGN